MTNSSDQSETPVEEGNSDLSRGRLSTGRRLLTFQPAIDDPEELRAFLRRVIDRYNSERDVAMSISAHQRGQLASLTGVAPWVELSDAQGHSPSSSTRGAPVLSPQQDAVAPGINDKQDQEEAGALSSEVNPASATQMRAAGAAQPNAAAPSRSSTPEEDTKPPARSPKPRQRRKRKTGSLKDRGAMESRPIYASLSLSSMPGEEGEDSKPPAKPKAPKRKVKSRSPRGDPTVKSPPTAASQVKTEDSSSASFPQPGINPPRIANLDKQSRASIQRVKAMSFDLNLHAPDPEQDTPPGETELERKRRKERINGRRKRIRRLIEIDHRNNQVVDLTEKNEQIRSENQLLRERITTLRQAGQSGSRQDRSEALASPQSEAESTSVKAYSSSTIARRSEGVGRQQSRAALPATSTRVEQPSTFYSAPHTPLARSASNTSQHYTGRTESATTQQPDLASNLSGQLSAALAQQLAGALPTQQQQQRQQLLQWQQQSQQQLQQRQGAIPSGQDQRAIAQLLSGTIGNLAQHHHSSQREVQQLTSHSFGFAEQNYAAQAHHIARIVGQQAQQSQIGLQNSQQQQQRQSLTISEENQRALAQQVLGTIVHQTHQQQLPLRQLHSMPQQQQFSNLLGGSPYADHQAQSHHGNLSQRHPHLLQHQQQHHQGWSVTGPLGPQRVSLAQGHAQSNILESVLRQQLQRSTEYSNPPDTFFQLRQQTDQEHKSQTEEDEGK